MTGIGFLRPAFVEHFPAAMEAGVLYISVAYGTCGHLCCCGCGQEVVTPLSPAQWAFTYDGENIFLTPSVGNWGQPCQSHYWIRKGKVCWDRRYSPDEVAKNRARDRSALAHHASETTARRLPGISRLWGGWRP